jgi:hypothetical protein
MQNFSQKSRREKDCQAEVGVNVRIVLYLEIKY